MGRPRAIQGEVEKRLLGALESGLTIKLALEYAGVSHDAWADELKRNPGFAERATRARLKHLPVALDQIREAGKQDHRAARAWVEMVFRDDFGRRVEITQTEPLSFSVSFGKQVQEDFQTETRNQAVLKK